MGLIRQKNKGSGPLGADTPALGAFLRFFNENNAISGIFEL